MRIVSLHPYDYERIGLAILIACQLVFWSYTHHIRPDLEVVPKAPTQAAVEAMSLGDKQFYFRWLALNIQNTGDTFGRFTALHQYNFEELSRWFERLDALDSRSNMIPSMAAYYFSQTQRTEDVRYIVDYLYHHAMRDVEHKWWWLLQALYLSQHKLKDMDLALKVSQPLIHEKVPAWAQQMVAVVHEKRGEMEDALRIMETIRDHAQDIRPADLRYMEYFVRERLQKLDETNPSQ